MKGELFFLGCFVVMLFGAIITPSAIELALYPLVAIYGFLAGIKCKTELNRFTDRK